MYNPASIVDLRQNAQFNRSSIGRGANHLSASSTSLFKGAQAPTMNNSSMYFTDPSVSSVTDQSPVTDRYYRRATSAKGYIRSSVNSCEGCHRLEERVAGLEEKLFLTNERVHSFESQVLQILKTIASDIRDLKRGSVHHPSDSRKSHSVAMNPPPVDLRVLSGSCGTPTKVNRTSNFSTSSPSPLAKSVLMDACNTLEALIADAKRNSPLKSSSKR